MFCRNYIGIILGKLANIPEKGSQNLIGGGGTNISEYECVLINFNLPFVRNGVGHILHEVLCYVF